MVEAAVVAIMVGVVEMEVTAAMAAVAAARQGHTVSLVDINAHTGGVVSGGVG